MSIYEDNIRQLLDSAYSGFGVIELMVSVSLNRGLCNADDRRSCLLDCMNLVVDDSNPHG
jgi:hypothetical protein